MKTVATHGMRIRREESKDNRFTRVLSKSKQPMAFILFLAASLWILTMLSGCAGLPTTPETSIEGRTSLGIGVSGASSDVYPRIDQDWLKVNSCWGSSVNGDAVTVIVMTPSHTDDAGLQVFEYHGQYYYGMRTGDKIYVCPDLAALKHEFSHLVGEKTVGHQIDNGYGQCWL